MKVTEQLKNLLQLYSPSGMESEVIEYCAQIMKDAQFTCQYIQTDNGTNCLLAVTGKPQIILQTHADVVQPNVKYVESKTRIYGRGACDAKSSLASMLVACVKAKEQGLTNFGLLVTVSEESNFAGATAVTNSQLIQGIPVIVGEPTNLTPVVQQYGLEVYEVTSSGKSAHTSEPQLGINAVDLLITKLAQMRSIFTNPETLMSVTMIKGGTADNIVPDSASATISMRVSPDDITDYYTLLKNISLNESRVDRRLSIPKVSQRLPSVLAFLGKTKTVKYCTELAFWQKGVVYGPGDIKVAHTQNENITKIELEQAVTDYFQILEIATGSAISFE